MEAEDYEALSGVEASTLPVFEFEMGDEESQSAGEEGGDAQVPLPYDTGVDALGNVGNTEGNEKDGTIGSRLLGIQLEEEIRIDDLPL
ncbi:MAG: hypothetical protein A2756_03985 [Candidatus Ryanbacteria bacterium RIFCSPHIGHO2_01_FULL_48_27]|uniref:Uncharacterized protein n=1 Tax=Candidatus Ryanbacteria bacterium RIFCSPHIGHO2_01_FULL_48_27 TaxID=1802115 RepID=A0A1G2G469_9BACT|nr:MAG: hypothetical protein A2756_03985 [Candidatus Ryanbacteria bacterium RIFCSPHIGHO2_01_FULL_48_27]